MKIGDFVVNKRCLPKSEELYQFVWPCKTCPTGGLLIGYTSLSPLVSDYGLRCRYCAYSVTVDSPSFFTEDRVWQVNWIAEQWNLSNLRTHFISRYVS